MTAPAPAQGWLVRPPHNGNGKEHISIPGQSSGTPSLSIIPIRMRYTPMVTPSAWNHEQPAAQARMAPGAFPAEMGRGSPVPPAVSSALLDHLHVVGGGVRPLLQQM